MIKSCAEYVLFLVSLRSNLRNTVILQFGDPLCAVAMVFEMMMALFLSCLVHCEASGLMEWRLGSMGSNIARAVVVEGMDPVWIIVVAIFVNGLLIGLLLGTCCFAGLSSYDGGYLALCRNKIHSTSCCDKIYTKERFSDKINF